MRRSITTCLWLLALFGREAVAPGEACAQDDRAIAGRVLAASDSAPLAGVRIRALDTERRTMSDTEGQFRLSGLPRGPLRLVFERIGIVPDTAAVAAGVAQVRVYLRARPVLLQPIVTEAAPIARERFELIAQTSTVSLDASDITDVPAIAEPDVARVMQLLPGTVAKNDFTVGLNVRGGESDQNLIRLDGITVFNPFHLGGLFGPFDPAVVARADFLTGGFPAQFGGRLSSVLDVGVRPGRRDFGVTTGVSLLSGRLVMEGPLGGSGASWLVAGRRTYADRFADAFSDDPFTYYFGDALAKVTAPIGSGSLAVTAFGTRDALALPWLDPEPGRDGVDLEFDWNNLLAGATYHVRLARAVELEQHVSWSEFATHFGLVPDVTTATNSARVGSAATTVGAVWGTNRLLAGARYDDYAMSFLIERDALGVQDLRLQYDPAIWSVFVDDQWRPIRPLMIRPGVRVMRVQGGADVTTVGPRLAVKVFPMRDLALTVAGGRYHQAIHSIRDQEVPITLFDFWIGADDVTPVARSEQLVVGLEKWFGSDVAVTIEGYAKSFADLAVQNARDDPKVKGDEVVPADGSAHGVDVLLRKHVGRVRGWISYSYLVTERRTATDTFPPAHDRRHTVNVVVQTPGPLGSEIGARWGYGSPLPFTGIVGTWPHRAYNAVDHTFDDFESEVLSTGVNGQRYPAYSRLDLSLHWRFGFLGAAWRPFLQVVNAYDRRNVFFYTFDYDDVPPIRSGFSQLPVLPTVGVEVEW